MRFDWIDGNQHIGYLVDEYDTIPECMFASVLMLTGLGGFEQTPYNTWAKLLASITAVVALCVFAVPAGIIASNYEVRYIILPIVERVCYRVEVTSYFVGIL